jgi:hypothetical protein
MLLSPELEKKIYAEQNHNIFLHENVVFKKKIPPKFLYIAATGN